MAAEPRSKALVLFSGGLDSILALRLVRDLGVDVEILSFYTLFHEKHKDLDSFRRRVEDFGADLHVPVTVTDHSSALLEAVRSPRHGYGKNANPCIDCRISMLRSAAAGMAARGASFLVTGEVLGQRPMSQRRRAMDLIEAEAGVRGRVLRPLSAGVLPETIPEKNGWIDRSRLLSFQGRSRKPQMGLAERLGMKDVPGSGGGCLLTFPEFATKVRDAVEGGDLSEHHARLLKVGRHFRLGSGAKVVVGRNEAENMWMEAHGAATDLLLVPVERPGPTALILGGGSPDDRETAAGLCGRYMKAPPGEPLRFRIQAPDGAGIAEIRAPGLDPADSAALQVGLGRRDVQKNRPPPAANHLTPREGPP